MSVINKMLRDLEQRQQTPITANYVQDETPNRSLALICVSTLAVIVLLGCAIAYGVAHVNYASSELPIIQTHGNTKNDIKLESPTPEVSPILEESDIHEFDTQQGKPTAEDVNSAVTKMARVQNGVEMSQSQMEETLEPAIIAKGNAPFEEVAPDSEEQDGLESESMQVASSLGYSRQVASLRESARIALESGQSARASDLLAQILEISPEQSSVRKQLASLLYANRDTVGAVKALEEGIVSHPEDSSIRLMQARISFRQGDIQKAQAILKEHPSTTLASTDLLSFRAAISEQVGDYKQAHSDYQSLTTREPNTAKWWLGLAVSQDKLKLPEKAVESYKRVQGLNQLSMQVHDFVKTRIDSLAEQS